MPIPFFVKSPVTGLGCGYGADKTLGVLGFRAKALMDSGFRV